MQIILTTIIIFILVYMIFKAYIRTYTLYKMCKHHTDILKELVDDLDDLIDTHNFLADLVICHIKEEDTTGRDINKIIEDYGILKEVKHDTDVKADNSNAVNNKHTSKN